MNEKNLLTKTNPGLAKPMSEQSSQQSELTLAHEWIEYLKRRSRNATILWVLFLVLATLGVSAAIYNYLQVFHVSIELKELKDSNNALSAEIEEIQQRFQLEMEDARTSSQEALDQANAETNQLRATLNELDQLKGQTGDQLKLSAKLVAALKEKIAALEDERSLLEDALVSSKQDYDALLSSQKINESLINEQRQDLSKRSQAYNALVKRIKDMEADLESRSDKLDRVESKLSASKSNQESLLKQIAQLNNDKVSLKKERDDMENKLMNLIQPVSPVSGTVSPASNPNKLAKSSEDPKIVRSPISANNTPILKIEPKAQPKEKSSTPAVANSDLSFDSIAVD